MGCKYVKEFEFGGPSGKFVKGYYRGGDVKADAAQDKAMVKAAVHKHERAMHPGKPVTKLANGGPVVPQQQAAPRNAPSRAPSRPMPAPPGGAMNALRALAAGRPGAAFVPPGRGPGAAVPSPHGRGPGAPMVKAGAESLPPSPVRPQPAPPSAMKKGGSAKMRNKC